MVEIGSEIVRNPASWKCLVIPQVNYKKAWDMQHNLVAARKNGAMDTDIIMMLEHSPVFTLGRRGSRKNISVPQAFLEKSGIKVVRVERGGDITYHGPGQIVVYPIVDLGKAKLTVADYVFAMEEIMIRTAGKWGVKAKRSPKNPGVWVKDRKLGSLGLAIRRSISFHGFAFNVNNSLEPFSWINPCGLTNTHMTSMEQELKRTVSMNKIRESLKLHIKDIFGIGLENVHLSGLKKILELNPGPEGRALVTSELGCNIRR
jgi:lipoate-protein ligase B